MTGDTIVWLISCFNLISPGMKAEARTEASQVIGSEEEEEDTVTV